MAASTAVIVSHAYGQLPLISVEAGSLFGSVADEEVAIYAEGAGVIVGATNALGHMGTLGDRYERLHASRVGVQVVSLLANCAGCRTGGRGFTEKAVGDIADLGDAAFRIDRVGPEAIRADLAGEVCLLGGRVPATRTHLAVGDCAGLSR